MQLYNSGNKVILKACDNNCSYVYTALKQRKKQNIGHFTKFIHFMAVTIGELAKCFNFCHFRLLLRWSNNSFQLSLKNEKKMSLVFNLTWRQFFRSSYLIPFSLTCCFAMLDTIRLPPDFSEIQTSEQYTQHNETAKIYLFIFFGANIMLCCLTSRWN